MPFPSLTGVGLVLDLEVIVRPTGPHRELVILEPMVGVRLPVVLTDLGRRSKGLGSPMPRTIKTHKRHKSVYPASGFRAPRLAVWYSSC